MQKLAVLVIAGLMSANASAINWVLLTKASGANFYVDSDSISSSGTVSNSGKYRVAFVKTIYDTPRGLIEQTMSLNRYSCNDYPVKLQVLSSNAYKDNAIIGSTEYNENAKWIIAYPNSVGDVQAKFICNR